MGPTWVLSAPDGPHVGPMNLVIRVNKILHPSNNTSNALAGLLWIFSQTAKTFKATSIRHRSDMKMWDHYNDVIMSVMRIKSPASWLFTQLFIHAQMKENIKAPRHWPLCGEFTRDQWIPHTKWGPVSQKMFPFDDVIISMSNLCRSEGVCYLGWCKQEHAIKVQQCNMIMIH